jgi:Protein of unknown function (DUF3634)
MFWILVIGSVGLAWLAAIGLGFVPPPHASTLVYVRNGTLEVRRGRLKPHAREHVTDILHEARVSRGYIAITSENRVYFSNRIPAALHQRLRNVLLNQWA